MVRKLLVLLVPVWLLLVLQLLLQLLHTCLCLAGPDFLDMPVLVFLKSVLVCALWVASFFFMLECACLSCSSPPPSVVSEARTPMQLCCLGCGGYLSCCCSKPVLAGSHEQQGWRGPWHAWQTRAPAVL